MVMTKGERDSTLCATAKLVCGSMKNVIQSLKKYIAHLDSFSLVCLLQSLTGITKCTLYTASINFPWYKIFISHLITITTFNFADCV